MDNAVPARHVVPRGKLTEGSWVMQWNAPELDNHRFATSAATSYGAVPTIQRVSRAFSFTIFFVPFATDRSHAVVTQPMPPARGLLQCRPRGWLVLAVL